MKFLTTGEMRELEQEVARSGVSWQEMMEQAGRSAAAAIAKRWNPGERRILVLCGKGNNGGDGFVAARCLAESGGKVTVGLLRGEPATPESRTAYSQMPSSVRVTEDLSRIAGETEWTGLIVDGVFGTGFSGSLPEQLKPVFAAARRAKKRGVPVAALDLPSGVNGDTGEYEDCIPADLTVAMGGAKPAHLVNWAEEYLGELVIGSIGAKSETLTGFPLWRESLELSHFLEYLPRRSHTGHKGNNGRLLLIAGCRQYPGAAALAVGAAARSGVGYVRLASVPGAAKIAAAHCPEAIYTICKKNDRGGIAGGEEAVSVLLGAAQGVDAVAVGCGMEPGPDMLALVRAFLRQEKPLLLDAGALTALAEDPDPIALLKNAACPVLITPHPGEYSRLTGEDPRTIGNEPLKMGHTIAEETGITVLLKGHITGITGPEGTLWHFGGCDGLAKGGSGDVLTGVIGGLMAQGASPFRAAAAGAWLHGRAAQLCAGDWSSRAMVPSQLLEYFGKAFLEAERELKE